MKVDMAMISSGNTGGSIMKSIANWLGDRANGIKKLVVKDEICIDDVCMTRDDLRTILQNNHVGSTGTSNSIGGGNVTTDVGTTGGSAGTDTTDTADSGTTTTDTSVSTDSSTPVVETQSLSENPSDTVTTQ